jgi:hypothetical protein
MIPRLPDVKPPCLTRPGNTKFPGRLFVRIARSWGVCGATPLRCLIDCARSAVRSRARRRSCMSPQATVRLTETPTGGPPTGRLSCGGRVAGGVKPAPWQRGRPGGRGARAHDVDRPKHPLVGRRRGAGRSPISCRKPSRRTVTSSPADPFDSEKLKAAVPVAREQTYVHLAIAEQILRDGRSYLLGAAPSIADCALYNPIWFLQSRLGQGSTPARWIDCPKLSPGRSA